MKILEPQKTVNYFNINLVVPHDFGFLAVGHNNVVVWCREEMFIPDDIEPYFYGWLGGNDETVIPLCHVSLDGLDWRKTLVEIKE